MRSFTARAEPVWDLSMEQGIASTSPAVLGFCVKVLSSSAPPPPPLKALRKAPTFACIRQFLLTLGIRGLLGSLEPVSNPAKGAILNQRL